MSTLSMNMPHFDLKNMWSNLVEQVAQKLGQRRCLPEFSGLPHEDPGKFLEEISNYFNGRDFSNYERLSTTLQQLRGEASELINTGRVLMFWQDLNERLMEAYGSPSVLADLRVSLFDEAQRTDQDVVQFLLSKRALANRLHPDMQEEDLVASIVILLDGNFARHINLNRHKTFDGLMKQARRFRNATPSERESAGRSQPLPDHIFVAIEKAKLRRQLLTVAQKEDEPVQRFIQTKVEMAEHLLPSLQGEHLTASVLRLLRHKITRYMSYRSPTSLKELSNWSHSIESRLETNQCGAISDPIAAPRPPHPRRRHMEVARRYKRYLH